MTESITSSPPLSIRETYPSRFPTSRKLYEQALKNFPNGVTHDGRFLQPFPVYIDRASGAHKWDVDGHKMVDYWMGHGSLLLGHSRPEVAQAIADQAGKGTHFGACHELEIEWADWIIRLVPCAERVRFVASGTEATMMAIRLARIFTDRRKVIKFAGHYHGWHDNVLDGGGPYRPPPGVLREVHESLIVLPPNDLNRLEEKLEQDDDIACLMLEPTGELFGGTPLDADFLIGLRDLTAQRDVVFIMDEVVTGFRCAPGGAQQHYGVTPDLCTMAKIMAGGLPGGAVAGRSDIMELLEIKADPVWQSTKKMLHYGTFNANPVSAAAGIATLEIVSTGEDIAQANARAALLRDRLAQALDARNLDGWRVYGNFSGIKISPPPAPGKSRRGNLDLIHPLRCALLIHGIDMIGVDALTSSAHSVEDIEQTAVAFDAALSMLKQDRII